MSKRSVACLAAPIFLVISAFVLALPGPVAAKEGESECGRYLVASMGTSAVMVDSVTGASWMLHSGATEDAEMVWLPVRRIDNPVEADTWLATQADRKQALEEYKSRKNK